jgi:predicted dehydrogenase
MDKVNLGVIGAGIWGEAHARIFSSHPPANLVSVCDIDENKAREIAGRYGAKKTFTDFNEMLQDPELDAVGITTPDFAHCEPFAAACRAGKHVLVEKPLATTAEDLSLMRSVHEGSSSRVMVDFHARWSPPLVVASDNLRDGQIGDLISLYYRLNDCIFVPTKMLAWAKESSILWFLGSHAVDTLRFLTSSEVIRVYSVSRSEVLEGKGIPVADIYQSILEFENGVIATIENAWIIPDSYPQWNDIKLNILGSKGMFNMDLTGSQAIERFLEDKSDNPDILIMPTIHGKAMGFAHESIRDFVDKLVSGDDFVVGFEDGYRVSKVILSIMEAASQRMPVTVQY